MMESTIIEVLKAQRNEAMDTIAILNAHLAAARQEITKRDAKIAGLEAGSSDQQPAPASYDTLEARD